jgi:polyisoprenoid-binding protein YceI
MKTKTKKLVNTMVGLSVIAIVLISSCKKENKYELLSNSTANTSDIIDGRVGGYPATTYTTAGAWKLDKSHSNVMWETKYYGNGAPLTGRFNMFDVKVKFDAAHPENTTVSSWVQLSTFNTGESGRDAYGKCGPGYMGIKWDTVTKSPTVVLKPQAATDTAWFKSTSCAKYGSGYLLKGNFTFRGITREIEMPLSYTGISTTTNATTGKKTDRVGLYGQFGINALTVFGVNTTSIDDLVTIRVDANLVTNAY